jgi:hypothetical protein
MREKRTMEHVREEITAEREALVEEIRGLRQDAASVLPYAIGMALAVAVLTKSKTARSALKVLWWLR